MAVRAAPAITTLSMGVPFLWRPATACFCPSRYFNFRNGQQGKDAIVGIFRLVGKE